MTRRATKANARAYQLRGRNVDLEVTIVEVVERVEESSRVEEREKERERRFWNIESSQVEFDVATTHSTRRSLLMLSRACSRC